MLAVIQTFLLFHALFLLFSYSKGQIAHVIIIIIIFF